jgi:hypothetical protein
MLCQSLHWLLLKCECIISYIEKKLINIEYKLGDNPGYDIFNKSIILLLDLISLTIIFILFYRNNNITKIIIIIVMIITAYVSIWKITSS